MLMKIVVGFVAMVVLVLMLAVAFWTIGKRIKAKREGTSSSAVKTDNATPEKKEIPEKKETAGKKEKPKNDAFGSVWSFSKIMLGFSIFAGLLCWVLFVAYKNFVFTGNNASRSSRAQTAADSFGEVPAEIALPIICGCESSNIPGVIKHFEDDGVTPLKNKPKPGAEPSSAVGGCQILASLHEKRAKDEFKLDIRTPEGNLAYAKILYNESTPHTKHWEGTPGNTTKGCWAPKLAELGSGQNTKYFVVNAPVGNYSDIKKLDTSQPAHFFGYGKKYRVLWNGSVEEDLPREKGVESKTPAITMFFQVKSREDEPVPITVVIGGNS